MCTGKIELQWPLVMAGLLALSHRWLGGDWGVPGSGMFTSGDSSLTVPVGRHEDGFSFIHAGVWRVLCPLALPP